MGGPLVSLFPQTKYPSPNWNMKHYNSVEILHQAPHTNIKPPQWRLSGDGSAPRVSFQKSFKETKSVFKRFQLKANEFSKA